MPSERLDGETRMTARERARRFWTAHGRSPAHMTVLYALATNPRLSWTPYGLSTWYGVPIGDVRRTFGEFVTAGVVVEDARTTDGIHWNRELDWALPSTKHVRRIVQDRWLAITTTCITNTPFPDDTGRTTADERR